MRNFIGEILSTIKSNKTIFIICLAVTLIAMIFGVVISLNEDLSCFYKEILLEFFKTILSRESFGVSYLIKRMLISSLILLIILLLSLNNYTFYISFLILFYRAFIIGLALKLFITELLVGGIFLFLFIVFTQGFLLCVAISLYLTLTFKKVKRLDKCEFSYLIKCYITSLFLAVLGCVLEFLFIVIIFRPFNLYF
ncbi:MAG: hypothetical protein J6V66_01395 [Clostridia bacterium]|nr:hypothetical protein [Clostridia bacterium]